MVVGIAVCSVFLLVLCATPGLAGFSLVGVTGDLNNTVTNNNCQDAFNGTAEGVAFLVYGSPQTWNVSISPPLSGPGNFSMTLYESPGAFGTAYSLGVQVSPIITSGQAYPNATGVYSVSWTWPSVVSARGVVQLEMDSMFQCVAWRNPPAATTGAATTGAALVTTGAGVVPTTGAGSGSTTGAGSGSTTGAQTTPTTASSPSSGSVPPPPSPAPADESSEGGFLDQIQTDTMLQIYVGAGVGGLLLIIVISVAIFCGVKKCRSDDDYWYSDGSEDNAPIPTLSMSQIHSERMATEGGETVTSFNEESETGDGEEGFDDAPPPPPPADEENSDFDDQPPPPPPF